MQVHSVPLHSVSIGIPSWRVKTVRSIQRTERLVQETWPGWSKTCVTGVFTPNITVGTVDISKDEIPEQQCEDSVCRSKRRPQTAGVTFPDSTLRTPVVPFPPRSLREQCAGAASMVAFGYMRMVRDVEAHLRREAGRVMQESIKLKKEQNHLEMMLGSLTAHLTINRRSADGRTRRPSTAETERDGADYLLAYERRELAELKLNLEGVLRNALSQLQALAQCRRQLLDCAGERAQVLDLLPHTAGGHGAAPQTFTRTDPVGPFTPECEQVLSLTNSTISQSQLLRKDIRQTLSSAITRQKAAHCAVNDGLVKKIAETVSLQQSLTLTAATARQAMFRKQREINLIGYSHDTAQGPKCSGDVLSREKLTRPLVQVYQRHPGTRLPEASQLIQSSAVLRRCLMTSEGELARLQRAALQLMDDMRRKNAAAEVDAAVVRMRRRQVDRRAMPTSLQQEAC